MKPGGEDQKEVRRRKYESGGFTIIEVLVATFVIGTTMVGVFGLFVLSLRLAQEGERRVVAVALANERAEMIRNLPYDAVGTQGGVPSGTIAQSEMILRNDVTYTVTVDIRYVDDPYDGVAGGGGGGGGGCVEISHYPPGQGGGGCQDLCVGAGAVPAHLAHGDSAAERCDGSPILGDDPLNTDYKQARVEVSWSGPNNPRPVLLLMQVSPPGIEGGTTAGTLDFLALDAQGVGVQGASVHLYNPTTTTTVDLTTLTNTEGRVVLPGLEPSVQSYELTVTKPGYTSEQTYTATANFFPDTDHSHLSMIAGEVTAKTFLIDQVARMDVSTVEPFNPASLRFDPGGGNDYVEVPHTSAYELANGTISFWFKGQDVGNPTQQGLWSKDADGFDSGGHVSMQLREGQLEVRHESATALTTIGTSGVLDDSWYHAAYTFGAGGMKLYLDGNEVATDSFTGGMSSNQEALLIGVHGRETLVGTSSPIVEPFDGLIDDVRLFDVALGVPDIESLAAGNEVTTNMLSHWQFNESAGPTATDSGVQGVDGTWRGGVTRSFDTPFVGGDGAAVPNMTYRFQGTKTIGQDAGAQPVYVTDVQSTTDVNGAASEEDVVWDLYSVTIDGAATNYDIRESSLLLPMTINPNDDLDLTLRLVDHTPRSLHVTVTNENGAALTDAAVQLTGFGHDEVLRTAALGQVLFADLPANGDYSVDITATGYASIGTSVTVSDTSRVVLQMTP